jgi:hypothetical protein
MSKEDNRRGQANSQQAQREKRAFQRMLEQPHHQIRLVRVRVMLDMLDTLAAGLMSYVGPYGPQLIDFQAIERAAKATSAYSEQERVLAGRPMPGSLKPKQERESKRRERLEPE